MMRLITISIAFIIFTGCASTVTETDEYYYAGYQPNYPIYYPSLSNVYQNPMYYDTYFGGPIYSGPFQYGNYGYSSYDLNRYYYYSKHYRYHH